MLVFLPAYVLVSRRETDTATQLKNTRSNLQAGTQYRYVRYDEIASVADSVLIPNPLPAACATKCLPSLHRSNGWVLWLNTHETPAFVTGVHRMHRAVGRESNSAPMPTACMPNTISIGP